MVIIEDIASLVRDFIEGNFRWIKTCLIFFN